MEDKSKSICTIPNILTSFRIILIPFIIWFYFDERIAAHIYISISLIVLSGITDIADGFIARKYNMISDVGRVLDPIADKLTQFSIAICLIKTHPLIVSVVAVIFVKEMATLIGAIIFINKVKTTPQAQWWGKMTTVVIYLTILFFIICDLLEYTAPAAVEVTVIAANIGCMVFAFLNYLLVYIEGRKRAADPKESENTND